MAQAPITNSQRGHTTPPRSGIEPPATQAPASYTPSFSKSAAAPTAPEHATRIEEAFSNDAERRWHQARLRRALVSLTIVAIFLAGAAYGYSRYTRYEARKAKVQKLLQHKPPPALPKHQPKEPK